MAQLRDSSRVAIRRRGLPGAEGLDGHSDPIEVLAAEPQPNRAIRWLDLVAEIAEAADAGLAPVDMLQHSLRVVIEGTGWMTGFVYLARPAESLEVPVPDIVWQPFGRQGRGAAEAERALAHEPDGGLAARVFRSGAPAWHQREASERVAPTAAGAAPAAGSMRTVLAFPVRQGGQVAAVLQFSADGSVEPKAGLLKAMLVIGAQVARVVEHSRLQRDLVEAEAARTSHQRLLAESDDIIRDQLARLHTAVNNTNHGLAMFDAAQRIVICNDLYASMYGLSANDVRPGTSLGQIAAMRRARGLEVSDELPLDGFEGSELNLSASAEVYRLEDGRCIAVSRQPLWDGGWVATHEDITARVRSEEQLAYLAQHDPLTGLANRLLFRTRLDMALATLRPHRQLALLWLDLDRFKAVNDTLGHAFGDEVLKAVAQRLRDTLRDCDLVARLGGDEFVVLQAPIHKPSEAAALAQRIVDVIRVPIACDGHCVILDSSIGIALASAREEDAEQLMKSADLAMYRAKSEGGSSYCFFEPAMETAMRARRELELDLRQALVDDQFELHYQPIINIANRRIESCEALLRWRHPRRGPIGPDKFIPVAEEAGLMVALGDWVLRQACADVARLPPTVTVAVNISPSHVMSRKLTAGVERALAASRIAPARLEVEITETVLMKNTEEALRSLHELHALGLKIALDDFGTGYSSLSTLRSFPFDKIKIDRSFVGGLPDERGALAIVKAVCSLAGSLAATTVAEGVETKAQFDGVSALGCTFAQGYLFSRPQPIDAIVALLAASAADPAAAPQAQATASTAGTAEPDQVKR